MSLRVTIASSTALALALSLSLGCSEDVPSRPVPLDAGVDAPAPPVDAALDSSFEVPIIDASGGPPIGPRDRAGRALVARLLVSSANLDTYAQLENPFETKFDDRAKDAASSIGEEIEARLSSLDALDKKIDWPVPDGGSHPLLNVILNDGLIVDPSLPFAPDGYLDFEKNGAARTTCGGRFPGDDAVDKTLSFLITGARTGIGDGVAAPAAPPTLTFPYLAAPK